MTTSTPSVWLTLKAKDAPALIEYYVDTFGFLLAARYGEGDRVDHAQLNWPEGTGGIMLGSHRPGGEWALEPGTAGSVYESCADPVKHSSPPASSSPPHGPTIFSMSLPNQCRTGPAFPRFSKKYATNTDVRRGLVGDRCDVPFGEPADGALVSYLQ